ncbi:MAG TPA: CoA transferase [Dehalococcoidia bacterium]|nr:CoA transferase [Dehalococcoidia bacterium]
MSGPCEGTTLIDLTRSLAGALTTMLLADYGAHVVMLEPPDGHPLRAETGFLVYARGKESLRPPSGVSAVELLRNLAASADVLVDDCTEAEAAASGVSWTALHKANPRLIHCSLPSFGTPTPEGDLPPDDALVAARSGMMDAQPGFRDGPVFVHPPIPSHGAALLAAQAVAAALYARERDRRGRRVVVPLWHGALAMQASHLLEIEHADTFPGPRRTHAGAQPLYRLYQCQDSRWIHLGVLTPRFWPGVALAVGHPEWISDPRYKSMPNLPTAAEREAFMEMFAGIIDRKPFAEWERLFDEHDVPCAPAQTVDEFMRDPQVSATAMLAELQDPRVGRIRQMGLALDFERTPGAIRGPAPELPRIGARSAESRAVREPTSGTANSTAGTQQTDVTIASEQLPLNGIRILDLSSYIAGPLGPAFLADLGADVIKIESPEGDGLRANRGFLAWNRGKRGLGLDLKRPEARQVLYRLVDSADVLLENMRPGVMQRLGIDYETLRRRNPRLIYCSVTAFGATGPYRHKPGFDPLLQARSGIERTQGGFQNPPVFLLVPLTDNTCAMLNAVGIAMALFERERSGEGQRIVTSLLRAAGFVQSDTMIEYAGRPPRTTNDVGQFGPHPLYRLYRCADGWLFLAARGTEERQRLGVLLTMDCEPLDGDGPSGATGVPELQLAARLAERFAEASVATWAQRLRGAGVPAVRADEDYARSFTGDPLLLDAGLIVSYRHPVYGRIRQPGVLARFGSISPSATCPAPLLGQHSREILAEAGYDSTSINALIASRAVVETAQERI